MVIGTQIAPLSVVVVAWQLGEEGIDARPGYRLSWPVSVVNASWVRALGERSVDLMVDTYLPPEDVLPPGFLRVDGVVATVEAVRRPERASGPRSFVAVQSTLGRYDVEVDGFIITLEAGAVVTAGSDAEGNRFETVLVTP